MSDTSQLIRDTFEEVQQKKRIQRYLDDLNGQLKAEYANLDRLEKKLTKEFKDIERLEKLSIKGLFHSVLGSKVEQMEKERQEYLQASLKFDEAKKTVELLEFERKVLEDKLKGLQQLEGKFKQLMKQREEELVQSNSQEGQQILDLVLKIDENIARSHNLTALFNEGVKILDLLNRMINHLSRARNWGQWDMYGDRRGAVHFKHSAIDNAKNLAFHAKNLLRRYEYELQLLFGSQNFNLNIHMNDFSRFTDIFFDNLISDWIIQQKISNALSNVKSVSDKVKRVQGSLQSELQRLQSENHQLEEQRKKIIIES